MNLTYNDDGQKEKTSEYVTKKSVIIVIITFIIILVISIVSLILYFNDKLQKTVESIELKDSLTLIQDEDDAGLNNVRVE